MKTEKGLKVGYTISIVIKLKNGALCRSRGHYYSPCGFVTNIKIQCLLEMKNFAVSFKKVLDIGWYKNWYRNCSIFYNS